MKNADKLMKKKIASLTRIYVIVQMRDMPLFEKMVIEEIGESGWKEVEQEAWSRPRNKDIFGEEK